MDDLQGKQPNSCVCLANSPFLKTELECLWEDTLGDPMALCHISCVIAKMGIIPLVSTVQIQGIEY